jgi:hypothetical protein
MPLPSHSPPPKFVPRKAARAALNPFHLRNYWISQISFIN